MAYDTIEITDFRGIEHLALNDLGSINIFTGRNNTGKSSCLEAISLLASGNSGFKNSFKQDILKFITFRRSKSKIGWNYLLRENSKKATITGFKKINEVTKTEGVVIAKTIEDLGLSINEPLVQSIKEQLERNVRSSYSRYINEREYLRETRKTIPRIENSLFFYFNNSIECLAQLYQDRDETDVVSTIKRNEDIKPVTDDILFIGNFEDIQGELHDKSAEAGHLFPIIERLKEKFPDIQDLRRIGDVLYVFYKNGKNMPLATMGDGFKVSLLVSLSLQTLSNGILVLEEPENYLHPGLMMHLIEELIIACKEHNIQIFTSTHNDEFIKFCLERSKKLDVSIIKMSRVQEKVEAEVITKPEAQEHVRDLGVDLRGF